VTKREGVLMGTMLSVLVASALAAIYTKYYSRQLFTEIQKQEKVIDQYEVEWGQLQLEMATFTEHVQIEQMARRQLKLVMPQKDKIIYLKP
jgi:cell division protein FtsL